MPGTIMAALLYIVLHIVLNQRHYCSTAAQILMRAIILAKLRCTERHCLMNQPSLRYYSTGEQILQPRLIMVKRPAILQRNTINRQKPAISCANNPIPPSF